MKLNTLEEAIEILQWIKKTGKKPFVQISDMGYETFTEAETDLPNFHRCFYIIPKSKKVLKKVPLDKGTIELGDWVRIRFGNCREIINSINNACYETSTWSFTPNQIYEEYDYSKDRGQTWLPMYKEVEVEE